mmetsp:Transcript_19724/g.54231  ORF Transcript_19724/g.54231 Transcript_19724/m.54231 type:complete len:676 (-) Transcript_19724:122-2149(-)
MALPLRFSPEVQKALDHGLPLVALESTIISHGMPYPQNVACAREVEAIVRSNGATPATIGIIDGDIYVGMTDAQLEKFGQTHCEKVSRRDLSTVVGLRRQGATTVAATMLIAHVAGIRVFVTGGIGGVHRGAEESWDVSADLTELGRTPVAVVCAGAKSILDIPKTLEYLETQGVTVIGLRTDTFPAFFTPSSGLPVPTTCSSEQEVASIIDAQVRLGLMSGLVVGNPVPAELAAEAVIVEKATEQAVAEAAAQGVAGRDTTPFLLKRINEITGGESLRANIELIKHNALVGTRIAAALQDLRAAAPPHGAKPTIPPPSVPAEPKLAIVGGAVLDFTAKPFEKKRFGEFGTTGTSILGSMHTSVGGVGRNFADSVSRLARSSDAWMFETVLGDDAMSEQVAAACSGFPALIHRLPGQRGATYTAVLDGTGELVSAIADMAVFEAWPAVSEFALRSRLLLMDTNVPAHVLEQASRSCREFWAEPVSVAKATRLCGCLPRISLASPNVDELRALVEGVGAEWSPVDAESMDGLQRSLPAAVEPLLSRGVRHLLVTCGALGAVLCSAAPPLPGLSSNESFAFAEPGFVVTRQQWASTGSSRTFVGYSVPKLECVESVTGAGDSLIAAMAWAYGLTNVPLVDAVLYGLAASRLCLASSESVSPLLSPERIAPRPMASRL